VRTPPPKRINGGLAKDSWLYEEPGRLQGWLCYHASFACHERAAHHLARGDELLSFFYILRAGTYGRRVGRR
jgi:hypothetical protein